MEETVSLKNSDNKKLTPVFGLIGKAFETYFKGPNLFYIIKVTVISTIIGIVPVIPMLMGWGFYTYVASGKANFSSLEWVIFILMFILCAGAAVTVGSWLGASQIVALSQIYQGKIIGIKQTLKLGWTKVWKYFGVVTVLSLIIILGLLLLVVPGLILGIWFTFAAFLVVDKNLGFDALGKSKALVSGLFWSIVGRNLVFTILYSAIYMVLGFIPVLGTILNIFFAPFAILLSFMLYKDVLRVKEG